MEAKKYEAVHNPLQSEGNASNLEVAFPIIESKADFQGQGKEWIKMKNGIVEYETDSGKVKLSYETVKKYLVSGDPSKVTDQEVMMFIALCKYQKLNPFLREAYLIKYSDEPATIVTGKETFTKRAAKNELCAGWQAGVIVIDKDGKTQQRNGTLVLPGENLVGGWARIIRKDWKEPLEITVSLNEYIRCRRDGQPTRNWKEMPATMIRKVALVQALREAFPEDFQGMYSPEEMPIDDSQLPEKPVEEENKNEGA